ncbi:MAG: hypothetical protein ACE369_03535 [Roseovarius sp.]
MTTNADPPLNHLLTDVVSRIPSVGQQPKVTVGEIATGVCLLVKAILTKDGVVFLLALMAYVIALSFLVWTLL